MICAVCSLVAFFFSSRRRHTSCLSDWSSDVCSSDLLERAWRTHMLLCLLEFSGADGLGRNDFRSLLRSEERRVGKECRSRWWPYTENKTPNITQSTKTTDRRLGMNAYVVNDPKETIT